MSVADADQGWLVNRIDEIADSFAQLATDEMRSHSRSMLDSRRNGEVPPELIAGALALARESLRRTVGVSPDPATVATALQVVAGTAHQHEFRGDNRSAIVMALYWHSLLGQGVHFVGLDDARARAAREFFSPVGALLGCDAGLVTCSTVRGDRRIAYEAMVTFSSWEELAEDYLRDILQRSLSDVVQRPLCVAVVDDTDATFAARAGTYRRISAAEAEIAKPCPKPRTKADPSAIAGT